MLSRWESLSRVSRGNRDKSDKGLVSLGCSMMTGGNFVSAAIFIGTYLWKDYKVARCAILAVIQVRILNFSSKSEYCQSLALST